MSRLVTELYAALGDDPESKPTTEPIGRLGRIARRALDDPSAFPDLAALKAAVLFALDGTRLDEAVERALAPILAAEAAALDAPKEATPAAEETIPPSPGWVARKDSVIVDEREATLQIGLEEIEQAKALAAKRASKAPKR